MLPSQRVSPALSHIRELEFEWDVTLRGHSMEPALAAGSTLRIRSLAAQPEIGDVVAFWADPGHMPGRIIVHRVIAVRHHQGRVECQT